MVQRRVNDPVCCCIDAGWISNFNMPQGWSRKKKKKPQKTEEIGILSTVETYNKIKISVYS